MDVISDLPQAIIEIILTKLPIRDAVTTSVLSIEWRYKWTRITRLVFNDNCVPSSYEHDRQIFLLNFIKSFLLRRDNDDGPISEFCLSTSFVRNSPLLKECLLLLSKMKEGIKKLVFELGEGAQGESFTIPYSLFTFSNLTHLELARCAMFLPPNFKGFLNLKCLTLQQIEADQSSDGLAGLISSCPRLESLTLLHCGTLMLSIEAPNLKHLILEGEVMFIVLRHMPRLVAASFAITLVDYVDLFDTLLGYVTCKFDKILGDLPCIERLVGRMDFTKHLSNGIDNIRYPIMYNHLKMVELSQVNFEDLTEFVAVIRLILCSPNLAELRLSGSNATTVKAVSNLGFMETPCLIGCRFDRLRNVTITEVCGTPNQMGFIKLLLEQSPALQVMTLVASAYLTEGTSSVLEHLNVFRRASTKVDQVIFVQDGNSKFL